MKTVDWHTSYNDDDSKTNISNDILQETEEVTETIDMGIWPLPTPTSTPELSVEPTPTHPMSAEPTHKSPRINNSTYTSPR